MTKHLTGGHILEFDDADADLVLSYSWCAAQRRNTFYAVAHVPGSGRKGKNILLHKLLTGTTTEQHVDHRDGNGLNCRRYNLRRATRSQNQANQRTQAGREGLRGTEKLPGGRIRARIHNQILGIFDTVEEALLVRDAAMREKYGEFAPALGGR